MATVFQSSTASTPLALLMAEARAFLAKEEEPEFTNAQLKALARKGLQAKGEPIHHICEFEGGCTTVITDIDLNTATVRKLCWEHSGPHRRRKSTDPARMHCACGSTSHGWCSKASKRFAPNKPGPLRPAWADMVL